MISVHQPINLFVKYLFHSHLIFHTLPLECIASQRSSMWLTAAAATTAPTHTHTQQQKNTCHLPLSYTHTHIQTDSHPPAPPAPLMLLLLHNSPLPFLVAPTNGVSTQCFQHPIFILYIPASFSSLPTYYPLTDAPLQHHSPRVMPCFTSPQPNPHPQLHRV